MLRFLLLLLPVGVGVAAHAQPFRYVDRVFERNTLSITENVNVATVTGTYTDPVAGTFDLLMDVYQPPTVDTAAERPLIILAHGGSFLEGNSLFQPFFPQGTRKDYANVEFAQRFAERGYVVANMSYRYGWNALGASEEARQSTILQAVYRALSDAKTFLRFFHKSYVDDGNPYKIDTSRIVLAGSGTGGYLPSNLISLDKYAEFLNDPRLQNATNVPYIDTCAIGTPWTSGNPSDPYPCLGPLEGQGFLGYSEKFAVAVSLAGAALDTTYFEPGDVPFICMQGTDDVSTPFATDIVIVFATGQPVVQVSGSLDIIRRQTNLGNQDVFLPEFASDGYLGESLPGLYAFEGAETNVYDWYDDFTPAEVAQAQLYLDTVESFVNARLMKALNLPQTEGVLTARPAGPRFGQALQVFPNPAKDAVNVQLQPGAAQLAGYRIRDIMGRVVGRAVGLTTQELRVPLENLPAGAYLLDVVTDQGTETRKVLVQ